jgi:magnesium transporter
MRWNASKAGMPPGAAVHLGERRTEEVSVQTVWFSADNVRVTPAMSLDAPPDAASTAWVQVTGLHDPEAVGEVARHFGLDDLLVEDILNTGHRPKVVIEDGFVVLIMKQLRWNPGLRRVDAEQVTLVLSARGLLTLTEGPTDRLLDLWVDEYYTAVEALTVASERIESLVLQRPRPAALEELHRIRLAVLPARRMLHPLREALFKLQTDDRGWFPYETDRYLSDVAEHLTAVNEQLDALREHLAQTFDLYQSGISSRTNQVMQVLTIIATIFIPLTFVVGVYGMNFKYMPELQWRYGYAAVWAVMVLISGGMLLYFRRKRWM